MRCSRPTGTLSTRGGSPSRRMVSRAAPPVAAADAQILDRHAAARRCGRRCRSPAPRSRAGAGRLSPGRPGSSSVERRRRAARRPGTSCTCPSVSAMTPARRARGMSASARSMAANSRVPWLPPSGTSTVRSSSSGSRPSAGLDAPRGRPRSARRGRRCGRCRCGRPPAGRCRAASPGSPRPGADWPGASSSRAKAAARHHAARGAPAPAAPGRAPERPAAPAAGRGSAASSQSGRSRRRGEVAASASRCRWSMRSVPQPFQDRRAHAPGRPCSCRSARTSRGSRRSDRPGCAAARRRGWWRRGSAPRPSTAQAPAQSCPPMITGADAVIGAVLVARHPDLCRRRSGPGSSGSR